MSALDKHHRLIGIGVMVKHTCSTCEGFKGRVISIGSRRGSTLREEEIAVEISRDEVRYVQSDTCEIVSMTKEDVSE